MSAQHPTQKSKSGRILLFPDRFPFTRARRTHEAKPVADLHRYEQDGEPDDFPRRMKINVVAFAFIVVLTIAGVWLAEQLALLRKHSDCIFIGHKSCVDLEKPLRER